MRTPISYYGGKQRLLHEILPLIPSHSQYVEPFFGGGAVFFAKEPSKGEAINDTNNFAVNFYRVAQQRFGELQSLIKSTLHSEADHRRAGEILKNNDADPAELAWAFWAQTNLSFGKKINGGFAYSKRSQEGRSTFGKRELFVPEICKRLENVEIFNRDAKDLILIKDDPSTFFYVDPPYVSSDQGHYKGYTKEDFVKLLDILATCNSKFLLSSYPEPELLEYRERCGWNSKDIVKCLAMRGKERTKTECLTWNYDLSPAQARLFF
jgi:DNA adenine methylase